jgi:hypothetical protein
MRFLINLLQAEECKSPFSVPSPWLDLDIEDLQQVVDSLTIADAYLFPSFNDILLDSATANLVDGPLFVWAIHALADDEFDHILHESRTLRARLQPIPPTARHLLLQCAPKSLSQLDDLHGG